MYVRPASEYEEDNRSVASGRSKTDAVVGESTVAKKGLDHRSQTHSGPSRGTNRTSGIFYQEPMVLQATDSNLNGASSSSER